MSFYNHKAGVRVVLINEKKELEIAASKVENEAHDKKLLNFLLCFKVYNCVLIWDSQNKFYKVPIC